jgi:hypothetical protein
VEKVGFKVAISDRQAWSSVILAKARIQSLLLFQDHPRLWNPGGMGLTAKRK